MFVDECSTNIALTTLYARAPKGKRAFGRAPRNWGKNLTLICSLSTEGVGAAMNWRAPPTEPLSRPTWSTSWFRRSKRDKWW